MSEIYCNDSAVNLTSVTCIKYRVIMGYNGSKHHVLRIKKNMGDEGNNQ